MDKRILLGILAVVGILTVGFFTWLRRDTLELPDALQKSATQQTAKNCLEEICSDAEIIASGNPAACSTLTDDLQRRECVTLATKIGALARLDLAACNDFSKESFDWNSCRGQLVFKQSMLRNESKWCQLIVIPDLQLRCLEHFSSPARQRTPVQQ